MSGLLASVLPLALGAAVSPTLFALELLVLSGRTHRLARGWAIAAGAAAVLAAFALAGVTVLNRFHPSNQPHHSLRAAVIDFAAAALLALLALRSAIRSPTPAEHHERRAAGGLDTRSSWWFLGVGAVGMLVNFSTLVLFLPALHEITRSGLPVDDRVAAFALLFVVTLLPVILPAGVVTVVGHRADRALDACHHFVGRNARRITLVVEVVFAVYLTAKGFQSLP